MHSNGILLCCNIHPSKNSRLCKPIHDMHGRPKSQREFTTPRVGHSYMYLITHLQWKGIYHGAIYLINWNSIQPISTDQSKFCHFR